MDNPQIPGCIIISFLSKIQHVSNATIINIIDLTFLLPYNLHQSNHFYV